MPYHSARLFEDGILTRTASATVAFHAMPGGVQTIYLPKLADNGIIFDWQIGEEPQAPFIGPSPNLHLARIVQEAVTNVIKHAQASTITVATNERSITIANDGFGIARDAQAGRGGGHGIAGMRQRSARIGATFDIARTDEGTVVTLTFDPQKPLSS